jgi:hypothetical protein
LDGIAANANNYSLPFTDNSDNWDVAYEWGNHADGGYLTSVPSAISVTSVAIGSTVTLSESSDRVDLLYINSGTSGWGGLQIGNTSNEFIFSLMGNGNNGGIYDDQNGDWIIYWSENAEVNFYYNNTKKFETTSTGVTVSGEIITTGGNSTNWQTAYGWGNHASAGYLTSSGDTMTGTLTASGGINGLTLANGGISGSNYNITGVNQLEIADPGEGIVFKSGASGDITLAIIDDTTDNILRLSGTGAKFRTPVIQLNDASTVIQEGANNSVNISTATGSVDIGSMNSSWVHIQSDRDIYILPSSGGKVAVDGNLTPYSDNAKTLGASGARWSTIYGVTGTFSGDVVAYSDARVKENVETIETPLDKVMKLRGVSFNRTGEDRKNIGVIAQEIREVLPEVVHEQEDGMLAVAYGNIVGLLIEAMKEQQEQIDELKSMIGK